MKSKKFLFGLTKAGIKDNPCSPPLIALYWRRINGAGVARDAECALESPPVTREMEGRQSSGLRDDHGGLKYLEKGELVRPRIPRERATWRIAHLVRAAFCAQCMSTPGRSLLCDWA